MPREHPIVSQIKARVARKRDELDTVNRQIAELIVRREAISDGLVSDENLLCKSAPKKPRTRKELPAKTLGDQLDQANTRKGE